MDASLNYLELLTLIAPVFLIIGVGFGLRWRGLLSPEVESGVVQLVVRFLYPCLIVQAMLRADSFRESPEVLLAPVAGFLTISLGFAVALLLGRALGLQRGTGLRTFCFSVGIYNYGYIPIPLIENMFGPNELAALFVHNVGVELAVWTVGVSLLAGASFREGLKKALNPMSVALVVGFVLNYSGIGYVLPPVATIPLGMLAACAVPLGLLAIGANLFQYADGKESLWNTRDCVGGVMVRLGVLPLLGLFLAWVLPVSLELKRVLVIQAAMPAGVMPIVLAKHYGGQPMVAVRVVFATSVVGILTMPIWIKFGLKLVGG